MLSPFWGLFRSPKTGENGFLAAQVSLIPKSDNGLAVEQVPMEANGRLIRVWKSEDKAGELAFKSAGPVAIPASGTLYLSVSYIDQGRRRLRALETNKAAADFAAVLGMAQNRAQGEQAKLKRRMG